MKNQGDSFRLDEDELFEILKAAAEIKADEEGMTLKQASAKYDLEF